MFAFLYKLLQRRGVFYYLLFIGYQIFVHPRLLDYLTGGHREQPNLFLGVFLLALLFLELWGYWLKHPILVYYARRHPAADSPPEKFLGWAEPSVCVLPLLLVIFVPIFHLVMAFFLYMIAAQIGGFDPGSSAPVWHQLLFVAGFFAVLIKECGMIGLFYSPYGLRGPADNTYPTLGWRGLTQRQYPAELRLEHLLRDGLGDLILLVFFAVAYTVLWDFMGQIHPVQASSFGDYIFEYLGVGFYFLLTILPLQAVNLFQAVATRQTKTQRVWMVAGLLLIVLIAMLSFPRF